MWAIIGDVYDAVKTEEEKAAGIRRMGRRPARHGSSMQEVYATVFPTVYSSDPFPEALTKLLDGRSQRAFAAKIPCNQGTISRLAQRPAASRPRHARTESRLPRRCSPYFFVEYRAQVIGQMVVKILLEQPNMSIQAMKRVRAGS